MRASGWVGRRERVEGGQARMGSERVVVMDEDGDGRRCCWVGRVNSVVI